MSNNQNILLCDIGGTHARFARYIKRGEYHDYKKYRLDSADSFDRIIQNYLDDSGVEFDSASFAVARTAVDGVIAYKRFAGDPDYVIDFPALQKAFGWVRLDYMNDLAAAAHGTKVLQKQQTKMVAAPVNPPRNRDKVLVSVGTGVGHAFIVNEEQVLRTHGGHMLPVTVTAEQRDIEKFIRDKKEETLSLITEDFVSPRGLRMMTEYLTGRENMTMGHDEFADELKKCPDAVRLFFEFLGLHVHNLVSVTGFYGGVYLSGGVIDFLVQDKLTNWDAFDDYFRPSMVNVVNDSLGGVAVEYVTETDLPLIGLTVAIDD